MKISLKIVSYKTGLKMSDKAADVQRKYLKDLQKPQQKKTTLKITRMSVPLEVKCKEKLRVTQDFCPVLYMALKHS